MSPKPLSWALAIGLFLATSARARADCTEDGTECPGLAAAFAGVVVGGTLEGSIALGGLVTLIGGAVDLGRGRHTRAWRVANYVFGALNLAAGVGWGVVAIAGISPQFSLGFALPHLAMAVPDLWLAVASSHAARRVVHLSFSPLLGRDWAGHALGGVTLAGTF